MNIPHSFINNYLSIHNPLPTTLFEQINLELAKYSSEDIVKLIGYQSITKGVKALETYQSHPNSYSWLQSGFYDFHYNSREFLDKLVQILGIDKNLYLTEIKSCQTLADEYKKVNSCHIFINTNFKRTEQPVFALSLCEKDRRFKLSLDKLMFKSDEAVLNFVSDSVKKHYSKNNGELPLWGPIEEYVYSHWDETKYVFNSSGELLENTKVAVESVANISL